MAAFTSEVPSIAFEASKAKEAMQLRRREANLLPRQNRHTQSQVEIETAGASLG
jgi:hypothetical protein